VWRRKIKISAGANNRGDFDRVKAESFISGPSR
jgi:hypothetical protein